MQEDENKPSEAQIAAEISKRLEARLEQVEQLADVVAAHLEGGSGGEEEDGSEGGESGEGEEEEEEGN